MKIEVQYDDYITDKSALSVSTHIPVQLWGPQSCLQKGNDGSSLKAKGLERKHNNASTQR